MDMQVVRLQNLSWSASAPDIRDFFSGLHIPSGGVHIIGGKDGDCFVVFGSVDDARRAVLLDRNELNGHRVRLHYSDIDEMQDVIAIAKGEKPAVKAHDRSLSPFTGRKRAASPIYNQPSSKYTNRNRLDEDGNVGIRDDRDTDRNKRYYVDDNHHGRSDREDNYQKNIGGNATQSVAAERNRDRSQFGLSNNWNQPSGNQMYQPNNPSTFKQSGGPADVPVDQQVIEKLRQEALKTLSESQMDILQSALGLVNQNKRSSVPSLLEGINMRNGNERFESGSRGLNNANSANTGRFANAGGDRRDESTRINYSAGLESRRSFDDRTGNRSRDSNTSASIEQSVKQQGRSTDGRDRGKFDDKRKDFDNRNYDRGRGGFNMRETERTETNQFNKHSSQGERGSFVFSPGQSNNTFDGSQRDYPSHGRSNLQSTDNSNRDRQPGDKNYSGNREQSDQFSTTRDSRPSEKSPLNTGRIIQRAGDFSREENGRKFNIRQNERRSSDMPSNQPSTQLHGWENFSNQGPKDARPTLLPTPTLAPADMDSRDSAGLSKYSSEGKPIIPVTDPCVVMIELPPTASFKQLRGLFATHNMSPENIVIVRDADGAVIKAYAKLDNISMAAEALNELSGMKLSGRVIRLAPCSLAEYEDADKNYSVPGRRSFPLSSREAPPPFRPSRTDPIDRPGRPSFPLRASGNDRIMPLMDQDHRPPMIGRGAPASSGGRGLMEQSNELRNRPSSHERRSRDERPTTVRDANRPFVRGDRRSSFTRNDADRKESIGNSRHRDTDRHSERKPEFSRRRSRSIERSKKDDMTKNRETPRDSKNKDEERNKMNESSGNQVKETTEINSMERKLDLCLIFTDLPPKCTDDDMKKVLENYKYNPGSLYIEYNQRKSCTGTAYVEMGCETDYEKLQNTKIQVLGQTIQINTITKKQMAEYTKDHKTKFPVSDNGEYIIQLCGLPFDATVGIVKNFLHPADIKDANVRILQRPDGRCNGFGFVKVPSEKDKDEAMKHDKGYIGKRYVNMKIVSRELMKNFLDTNETKNAEGEASSTLKTDVIMRLANIRYDVREDQVEAFFREFGPIRGSVKIAMFNGMPTGRAVIRFVTQESAEAAKKELDGTDLNGRPIRISLLPA